MFDKMKQMMEMQKQMQEMKRKLDATIFEVVSGDKTFSLKMNGSQEIEEVRVLADIASLRQATLEKELKDTYNRAIRRSHEVAAQKMKEITGFNLPGM